MTSYIEIQGLKIQAFHGAFQQEHVVGHLYRVDCTLRVDMERAMATDRLDDTVSYAEVVDLIRAEMRTPSQLLEHVAGRIVRAVQERYPGRVLGIDLRIAKQRPPIGHADVEACAVHVVV